MAGGRVCSLLAEKNEREMGSGVPRVSAAADNILLALEGGGDDLGALGDPSSTPSCFP
jgi:hypothetical protein